MRSVADKLAVALVNVAEDVQLGTDALERQRQLFTANGLTSHRRIEDSVRRSVRQKDIGSTRNLGPDLTQRGSAIGVERPVKEARLPRTSIDPQAVQRARFILQIDRAGQQAARIGHLFKQKVVIARDDDFVTMRKAAEPVVKVGDFSASSSSGEVAGTDEQVPFGNAQLSVLSVGVADADNPHASDDSAA